MFTPKIVQNGGWEQRAFGQRKLVHNPLRNKLADPSAEAHFFVRMNASLTDSLVVFEKNTFLNAFLLRKFFFKKLPLSSLCD